MPIIIIWKLVPPHIIHMISFSCAIEMIRVPEDKASDNYCIRR